MKKFTLCSILVAFALCVAAVAQTHASGAQGTQGSSPSMGQQPTTSQPSQPGMSGQTGQTDQNTNANRERKLKGCVQSQGGQYVLETKKGKAINLTGQDVSAHVGHEVAVKGNFESGGAMSQSSSGSASNGEKTFNVTNVDMISDTCAAGKNKGTSGGMSNTPEANPNGNGQSSGSTGTTPPQ
jgi:hypothetical protein